MEVGGAGRAAPSGRLLLFVQIDGDEQGRRSDLRGSVAEEGRLVHHVAQKFSGRVANFVIELVRFLLVDAHHSLISLEEGQGAIALQVKVESTDDLLLNSN